MDTVTQKTIPQMRVWIRREDDIFVAYCADYNIAAHGDSVEQACEEFADAVVGHIVVAEHFGDDPFGEIHRAPPDYREGYERHSRVKGATVRKFRIPGFTTKRNDMVESYDASEMTVVIVS